MSLFAYNSREKGGCFMGVNRKIIGLTVKKLRNERKITQDVLSGLAGIARSHLAMIENGTKNANFETICKLAAAFDLRPSDLVRLFEETSEENGVPFYIFDA